MGNTYQKVLGIDYGTKRIGLAVSYGSLAEPLKVVNNFSSPKENDVVSDLALEELLVIISREKVEHVVVGLSENKMAEKIKLFALKLNEKLQMSPAFQLIKIEFFDETLSSHDVHKRLSQKGIKSSKKKTDIDHFAASLILEEWLETQH